MGCDIHAHIEVKINGKWEHYSHPNVPRAYWLFGIMAGVRTGNENPISNKRGLPEDISLITRLDHRNWNGDAHNHGYILASEFDRLVSKSRALWPKIDFSEFFGYLYDNDVLLFQKYREDYPEEIQDVRIVFWFDN